MSEWISVEERLPPDAREVLAVSKPWGVFVARFGAMPRADESRWYYNDIEAHGVTHWMPMPEAPEPHDPTIREEKK